MTFEDIKAHHRESKEFMEQVLMDSPKQRVFGNTCLKPSYNIRDYTNPDVLFASVKTRSNPFHEALATFKQESPQKMRKTSKLYEV